MLVEITKEAYKAYVEREIRENGFKRTNVITPDGYTADVRPCGGYEDVKSIEDAEFFDIDVDGTDVPFWGAMTFDEAIDILMGAGEYIASVEKERERCRAYFEEHEKNGWDDESGSFYSDWHKDLFGYRPHGHVFGVYVNPHAR